MHALKLIRIERPDYSKFCEIVDKFIDLTLEQSSFYILPLKEYKEDIKIDKYLGIFLINLIFKAGVYDSNIVTHSLKRLLEDKNVLYFTNMNLTTKDKRISIIYCFVNLTELLYSNKYDYPEFFEHFCSKTDILNNLLKIFENFQEIEFIPKSDESNPLVPTALIMALDSLKTEFAKENVTRVGIVRDMDLNTVESRLLLVNNAMKGAYEIISGEINKVNELITINLIAKDTRREYTIDFACHFVNLNGTGEIEDILKAIKVKDSPVADCIDEHLPKCLMGSTQELKKKELVKLWLNNYIRFDTLQSNERKEKNTSMENVMKTRTALFDFSSKLKELEELKGFLKMMSE